MRKDRVGIGRLGVLAVPALVSWGCGGSLASGTLGADGGGTNNVTPEAGALAEAATPGADAPASASDLGPPHGTIDPNGGGGTVNLLYFGDFGDVRPPIPDDDFQYPTATITSIMQGMDALNPEFAVASGDYMFVELISASASDQLSKLQGAEKSLHAPIFHAMGNHECNSFSDSNCPNLNESVNITTFLSTLLPWSKTPWFSFVVHTSLGDAKFVFVAVNAWGMTQANWLSATMAMPTRYTFVVRHHPTPDAGSPSSAIGVAGSDAILTKFPVTLFLYGHVHEYMHLTTNAVIAGNAGAPLSTGNYGYVMVEQLPTGNVSVTEYQQGTNSPVDSWQVKPDGTAAP